eukprot:scaffold69367_cov90-Cyclotella_meneghiniana.AAC.6
MTGRDLDIVASAKGKRTHKEAAATFCLQRQQRRSKKKWKAERVILNEKGGKWGGAKKCSMRFIIVTAATLSSAEAMHDIKENERPNEHGWSCEIKDTNATAIRAQHALRRQKADKRGEPKTGVIGGGQHAEAIKKSSHLVAMA